MLPDADTRPDTPTPVSENTATLGVLATRTTTLALGSAMLTRVSPLAMLLLPVMVLPSTTNCPPVGAVSMMLVPLAVMEASPRLMLPSIQRLPQRLASLPMSYSGSTCGRMLPRKVVLNLLTTMTLSWVCTSMVMLPLATAMETLLAPLAI